MSGSHSTRLRVASACSWPSAGCPPTLFCSFLQRVEWPVVYFLRLQSGKIYIGASSHLEQRLNDHSTGKACYTTRLDSPIEFLRVELFPSFAAARAREAQLKKWSAGKKQAFVSGDFNQLKALSRSRSH
jgi:putative endonuclease